MVTRAAGYTLDYYYAIVRGYKPLPPLADGTSQFANAAVPGAMPLGGFGERITAGPVVNGIIWPNGALYVPPAIGVQPSIASTSINDTAGGTGIRLLEVHYLDSNLIPHEEFIIPNGVAPVLMVATDVRWINCMHAHTVGAAGGAAGTITASFGGNALSIIAIADLRCRSSLRMVPKGKVCFVKTLVGGATSGTASASVHIELVASVMDQHQFTQQGLLFAFSEVAVQDSSEALDLSLPGMFPEGTIIGMSLTTDKAALVTGTWFGWLEDA
jgi:hypothetical protein